MRSDPGWDAFRRELNRLLSSPQHSAASVAASLSLPAEDVRLWAYGRQRPAFRQLVPIARAFGLPDTHFIVVMGILSEAYEPGPTVEMAIQLQDLRAQRQALLEQLQARGRESGVASLAKAAVEAGWAISIWPAFEGRGDLRTHVADRVSLRPADVTLEGADLPDEIERLFRDVAAIRRSAARTPGWAAADADSSHHFSLRRFSSPRGPRRPGRLSRISALGILSLTVMTWPADVAAHVASALGMGLTSTRALATTTYGLTTDLDLYESRQTEMLGDLLRHPQPLHVWFHHGLDHLDRLSEVLSSWLVSGPPAGCVIVRLREEDSVLEEGAEIRPRVPLELLREERRREDELLAGRPEVITLPVAASVPGADGDIVGVRESMFLRSAELSADVITQLIARDFVSSGELQDAPITRWMAATGRLGGRG